MVARVLIAPVELATVELVQCRSKQRGFRTGNEPLLQHQCRPTGIIGSNVDLVPPTCSYAGFFFISLSLLYAGLALKGAQQALLTGSCVKPSQGRVFSARNSCTQGSMLRTPSPALDPINSYRSLNAELTLDCCQPRNFARCR